MKGLCEDVFVYFLSLWTFWCLYMIIMLKRQDSGHIEFTRASYLYLCLCFFSSLCVYVWNQIVSVIFQSREARNEIALTFLVPTRPRTKHRSFNEYDVILIQQRQFTRAHYFNDFKLYLIFRLILVLLVFWRSAKLELWCNCILIIFRCANIP